MATFVTAGYLLASSTEPPKAWFEYLDEVEAALSASRDTCTADFQRAAPGVSITEGRPFRT